MLRLPERDLRRFSTAAADLARIDDPATASNEMLRVVSTLVPVDRLSYNVLNRSSGRVERAHSIGDPPSPDLVASLNFHIHEHPGFSHPESKKDWPRPMKLSDFLSQRQFQSLGLYSDHFRLFRIRYQLGVNFAFGTERKISFGLNRSTKDFSEEERLLLELLRPHLLLAQQRVVRTETWREALTQRDEALAATRSAMVLAESDGRIRFISPEARALLARFSGAFTREPNHLPAALLGRATNPRKAGLPPLRGTEHRLRCEVMPVSDMASGDGAPAGPRLIAFRLREVPAPLHRERLASLGLAPRECEVLFWLAQGKRNSEIAIICRMTRHTAATHVRNILAALGAETRTAAAALAWEAMLAS